VYNSATEEVAVHRAQQWSMEGVSIEQSDEWPQLAMAK